MKKMLSFWVLMTLLLPLASRAQETLTVANGTSTNDYVPVYGLYLDYFVRAQFIYPASMLEEMGSSCSISGLTFYLSSSPATAWTSTLGVKMMEVADTVFSSAAFTNSSSAENVYTGTLTISAGTMVVELDNTYTYSGGNLLVEFYSVTDGNYSSASFYGTARNNASVSGYNSAGISSITSITRRNFLPKTTFSYISLGGDVCFRPKSFTAGGFTTTEATLSWVDTSNASASYTLQVISGTDTIPEYNVSSPHTVYNLTANTPYTFRLMADCGSSQSSWATTSGRTNCDDITLPILEGFEGMPTGTGALPVCWNTFETSTSSSSKLYVSTSYHHTGAASLYFYPYGSQYVVSERISASANELAVNFWARVANSVHHFEAGLMTDPDDTTTFVTFFSLVGGNGATWQEYEFFTDTTTIVGDVYLAFRARCTNGYAAYLDDISISVATSCRRPGNPMVLSSNYESATLTWTDSLGAPSYDIAYSTTNNVANATIENNITAFPYTLSGLQPGTTYYTWVRSVCAGGETAWRAFPSFTTDLTCYPVANATINNIGLTSASLSWEYANRGRGYTPTGVIISWQDLTDTTTAPQSEEVVGTTHFLTGLTAGHNYSVTLRTVCDPDTSATLTGSFSTLDCGTVISDVGATGTSTSSNYPVHGYYNNSYCQMLYPLSGIAGMDTIYGISIQATSTSSSTVSGISVYMGVSNQSTFSGTSNYIPYTELTLVATNKSIATTGAGWYTITFDTPYVVGSGGNNLVVTLFRNSTYTSTYPTWATHATSGCKTLYKYTDASLTIADPMVSGSAPSYRPNMSFVGTCNIDCYGPNVLVAGSDINSVDLQWVPGIDETSWELQYRIDTTAIWTDGGSVSTSPHTVNNLLARSHYYFRLGTVCASGDTIWSNVVDAYTGCDAMTLPFAEGFEGMPTSTAPLCWTTFVSGSGSAYVSSSYTHEGTRSAYLYPSNATSSAYLISGAIPASADELEISFWARVGNSTLSVGLVSDPEDFSTFIPLMVLPNGNNSTYTEYTVFSDTVSLTGTPYLVFRVSGASASAYIDDIGIAINTGCIRPTDAVISNITATEATLSWTGDPSATYEVRYATVNDPEDADAEILTATDTSIVLNVLPNTQYYVWVRTVCGGDVTLWASTSFASACDAYTLPFSEDFTGATAFSRCWSRRSGAFDTILPAATTTSGWNVVSTHTTHFGSPSAVRVNVYGSSCNYWLVSPTIDIDDNVVLSFDAALTNYSGSSGSGSADNPYTYPAAGTSGSDDRFVVGVVTDSSLFTPLAMWGSDATRDNFQYYSLTTTPSTISLPLGAYQGEQVQIAFFASSTVSNADNYLWIDNIAINDGGCLRPVPVAATTTDTSATVTWTDYSTSSSGYALMLSPSNSPTDTAAITVSPVTDTAYTFTGLQSSTTYYWFVRSLCETDVNWVAGPSFRTQCSAVSVPYYTGFEEYATNAFPECWTEYPTTGSTTYNHPRTSSSNVNSGSRSLQFTYSNNSIAVMPATDVELNTLQVRCFMRSESTNANCGTFEVGYITDIADTSTFVAVSSYSYSDPNANVYHEEEIAMSDAPEGARAAFRHRGTGNYYWHIDDVYLEPITTCERPTNPSISGIYYYGATFMWEDAFGIGNYELRYSTVDDVNDSNAVTITGITNEFYSDSTMSPDTRYYVWVRSNCGNDHSNWRTVGNFTTERSCYPILNLTNTNLTSNAASFTWELDNRGFEVTDVVVTLIDLTAGDTLVEPASGTTHHFFTSLQTGHSYKVLFNTVCDPDTASAVIYNFAPAPEACASVIGNSTYAYVPMYGLYNYSFSEMLYPASMLTGVDTIQAISFNVASSSTTSRIVSLYLGHTDRTKLTSNRHLSTDALTLVLANASMSVSSTGWVTLNLTTPFAYNSDSNLVVAMINHTGAWNSFNWSTMEMADTSSIVWYEDNGTYSLSNYIHGTSVNTKMLPSAMFHGNCATVSCPAPILVVSGVDTNSVSLAWVSTGNETSWAVQYSLDGNTWVDDATATTTSHTVSGLNSATFYHLRVGALCGSDTAWSTHVSTYTGCAPVEAPFYDGFNASELSPCWVSNGPYLYTNNSRRVLYTTNTTATAMTPEINADFSTLQVRLNLAASSASYGLKVGVANADGTGIQWVDTITGLAGTTSNYEERIVYLSNYTGTGNRVVLSGYNTGTSTSAYIYIDDLWVEEIDACIPVSGLTVDAGTLTGNTADISWTPGDSESQWLVYLNGDYEATVNTPSYSFTSLNASSSYTVSVRSFCGGTDTARAVSITFSTPCGTITDLPWSENFDAMNSMSDLNCWSRLSGLYTDSTALSLSSTTSGWARNTSAMGGSTHVKLNIYGTSCRYWLVTPTFNFSAPAELSFDYALTKYNTTSPVESTTPDDRFMVLVSTDNGVNWTPLASWEDSAYAAIPNTGASATLSLASYVGQNIKIAFYGVSTVSGGDNDLHIDNILIDLASGVTTYTVTLASADASMGSVSPDGSSTVAENTSFTATATANSGYRFVSWTDATGATVSTANPYTFTVTADAALTATFEAAGDNPDLYTVSVNADASMGSVLGAGTYTSGTQVTLTAMPNDGYRFVAWMDGNTEVSTANPYTFTITANVTLSAIFAANGSDPEMYTVTVNYDAARGTVQGAGTYVAGTQVTLTATSNPGFRFAGWSNGEADSTYTFTITSNVTLTANFEETVGIDDVETATIGLYPNPARTTVTLSGLEPGATVTIVDLNGREVSSLPASDSTLSLDVSDLAQGAYFVRITGQRQNAIRKLIVT